ncbi:MAG: DMT family transporter [Actinomycetota bacterium]|nr:DMT family transporter [Actinomycetota bacterium]
MRAIAIRTGERGPAEPWLRLGLAILATSSSAILVRYAEGAPALALAFWRCALGALCLAPWAQPRLSGMRFRQTLLPAVAGAFLAVHFGAWISSIGLTTVASSILLVSTTPIFVATADRVLFGVELTGRGWAGIALALAGVGVISGGDFAGGSIAGDGLALAGAVAVAGYLMAGQRARRSLGTLEYAAIAYGCAAVLLSIACGVARIPLWGWPGRTWLVIALMVAGPQLLGHTMINFVLKAFDATTVTVTVMLEPVVTILLALALLDEVPSLLVFPGGVAILTGIYAVARSQRPVSARAAT